MLSLGQLHLATAVVSLVSGAWVLSRPKGDRTHRRVGWIYVVAMVTLNVTALLIYRLTGTFGPFHVAAIFNLGTLLAGLLAAWQRKPAERWLGRHYFFMAYSYLGLVCAAVAETATRVPALRAFAGGPTAVFWVTVVVTSVAVFVVGNRMIRRNAGPVLTRMQGTGRAH
ncbi:MAG: DUF2306 domain-containing protein [Gemmatimonadota bacterium]